MVMIMRGGDGRTFALILYFALDPTVTRGYSELGTISFGCFIQIEAFNVCFVANQADPVHPCSDADP